MLLKHQTLQRVDDNGVTGYWREHGMLSRFDAWPGVHSATWEPENRRTHRGGWCVSRTWPSARVTKIALNRRKGEADEAGASAAFPGLLDLPDTLKRATAKASSSQRMQHVRPHTDRTRCMVACVE
jgi:hypothetical protein